LVLTDVEPSVPPAQILPHTDPNGNISLIGSSFGLALTLWDGISQGQGRVKQGLILASGYPPDSLAQQFIQAFDQLLSQSRPAIIVIALIESAETIDAVATALSQYLTAPQRPQRDDRLLRGTGAVLSHRDRSDQLPLRQANGTDLPPVVIYVGEDPAEGESFHSLPLTVCSSWEQTLQQVLQLARRP
jgi:hypothetical protein